MKAIKYFIVFIILELSCFASLTRVSVFGTQPVFVSTMGSRPSSIPVGLVAGSLWLEDEMNVFYNPSLVSDYKNQVRWERSAEGGVFTNISELFYLGLYFNRGGRLPGLFPIRNGAYVSRAQSVYAPGLVAPGIREIDGSNGKSVFTGNPDGTAMATFAPIDLFLAGDYGAKWGLHLAHARNPYLDTPSRHAQYWSADLGIQILFLEAFYGNTFHSSIRQEKKGMPNDETVQNLSEWNAGIKLKYESWSPYLVYKSFSEMGTPSNSFNQISTRLGIWGMGMGHSHELFPSFVFIKHLGIFIAKVNDQGEQINERDFPSLYKSYTQTTVPLNLGFEYSRKENITLRFGCEYNLIDETDIQTQSSEKRTAESNLKKVPQARLGVTYRFSKKLQGTELDFTFGNGKTVNNSTHSSDRRGLDNKFFALLTLKYSWDQIQIR